MTEQLQKRVEAARERTTTASKREKQLRTSLVRASRPSRVRAQRDEHLVQLPERLAHTVVRP